MAESKVVVYAALAGNAAIAAIKFVAASLSGSSSMLSEAVHSVVDTLDQLLLLWGGRRGARPPDPSHPFGYGLEVYFWSFTVSLMVFLLGGAVSVYEGVLKLRHPEPSIHLGVGFLVLALSAVFEGASFAFSYVEFRKRVGRRMGLVDFLRRSKDPNFIVTLMEDGAALTGLALAALGLAGQAVGLAWADGAASIAIGLLLTGVAWLLANETRSLVTGESADASVVEAVSRALEAHPGVGEVEEVATLQLGPDRILVALTIAVAPGREGEVERVAAELTDHVRVADPRVFRVYFRPLRRDGTGRPG